MRANLVAIGSHGDVLPFIAIGSELKKRGYDVTLASTEPFRHLTERQSLRFESLATTAECNCIIETSSLWTPIRGVRLMTQASMQLVEPVYDFVVGHHRPGDTVTVASTLGLGARVAHERHRIPLATVHLAPLYIRSGSASPRMPGLPRFVSRLPAWSRREVMFGADRFFLDPLCKPLLAFRANLGLPPLKGVLRWWLHSPDCTVAMFPSWYASPQPDWPKQMRQVGFPDVDRFGDLDALSPALQRFLESGSKPVVFTFGSAMVHDDSFVRTAIEVCRRLGRRGVIVSTAKREQRTDPESAVFQAHYMPFKLLFEHCDAVVHHGGVGTVASALRAGLPQLIVPMAFDHFDEADRVERLGVGTSIHRRLFRPAFVARALEGLLSDVAVRRRCADWATKTRQEDGTHAVCAIIEQLVRQRSGSVEV